MDACHICLQIFTTQLQGVLEKCIHRFCLQCILKSSKTGNQCPVDRLPYTSIKVLDKGEVIATIPVKERKRRTGPVYYDFTRHCEKCQKAGKKLLLCDGCDLAFHVGCLGYKLKKIPKHEWYCEVCSIVFEKIDRRKKENKEMLTKEEVYQRQRNDQMQDFESCSSSCSSILTETLVLSEGNQSCLQNFSPVQFLECSKLEEDKMIVQAGSSKESDLSLNSTTVQVHSTLDSPDSVGTVEISSSRDSSYSFPAMESVSLGPTVARPVRKPPFDKPVTLKYLKKNVYLLPTGLRFARNNKEIKQFLPETKKTKLS